MQYEVAEANKSENKKEGKPSSEICTFALYHKETTCIRDGTKNDL